ALAQRLLALEALELDRQGRGVDARAVRARLRAAGVNSGPDWPIARGRAVAKDWIEQAKEFLKSDQVRSAGLGLIASIVVDRLGDEIDSEMAFDATTLYAEQAHLPLRAARAALYTDALRLVAVYDEAGVNDGGALGDWLD